ncbi:MAG: KamA family radical SAM protein [Deltaproteobacteria bacterium]|nr:MAG: KamA family radical SAM protein [Deltaproteobacteria bacterium]
MKTWQELHRQNITSIDELRKHIPLTRKEISALERIHRTHPLNVTRYYLSLINPEDPKDPIRKMVIPSIEEFAGRGYIDTSGEFDNTKARGLQHKYRETALFILTSYCFAYCRFCFRKRFVGVSDAEILKDVREAISYVREHPEITNVLLSGGDALSLSNRLLSRILRDLDEIPHLKYVRIGTRVPVVFPQRITEDRGILRILKRHSRPDRRLIIQTHFNHPRELTEESLACVDALLKAGLLIHNQTVLLRGVNDDPETLSELMRKLIKVGVHPYYVFQCRPVVGILHMQVPISKGITIVEKAKSRLSGPAKMFRYIMSHRTGKIEIVGQDSERIYFKYHQAKDPRRAGKFFSLERDDSACWLDELIHTSRRKEALKGFGIE